MKKQYDTVKVYKKGECVKTVDVSNMTNEEARKRWDEIALEYGTSYTTYIIEK